MAMVINEYGSMEGLITTNDILKAIVGYVAVEAQPAEPYAIQREDGPWLMDGLLTLDEFRKIFPMNKLPQEEKGHYHTLAGFIMTHLGRVPAPADYFEWGGLRFEVVDMDGRRIDRVMVSPASPSTD
jgi:putative hemolysin